MSIINEYGVVLTYKKFRYLTIPNFIFSQISFICNGFLYLGDGIYAIFTPIYTQTAFSNSCTALLMDSSVTWT